MRVTITMSPSRAKKKTVGTRGGALTAGMSGSKLTRHVQRAVGDVVEGIGPVTALGLPGHDAQPVDFGGIAQVDADIPERQYVAPLHAGAVIESVSGCQRSIARSSQEQVERERIVEAIAVVDDACTDKRDTMDVVCLQSGSEILMLARGATRSDCKVWPEADARARPRRV